MLQVFVCIHVLSIPAGRERRMTMHMYCDGGQVECRDHSGRQPECYMTMHMYCHGGQVECRVHAFQLAGNAT